MDRLGGLLKRLPATGLAFLVGAVAICGLPPLNGFVSEFLVYVGLLSTLPAGAGARLDLGRIRRSRFSPSSERWRSPVS